jgi:hypothetical protein
VGINLARTVALTLAATTIIGACGDDSPAEPDATTLRVAGTYDTAVTIQQDGCSGTTVRRFVTTVAHAPGATTLTVTHAGNDYVGAVQRNGAFTTSPKVFNGPGETQTFTIAGTFSATAIDALVTASVQRTTGANCQYLVRWAGPKQGGPNVIPGS